MKRIILTLFLSYISVAYSQQSELTIKNDSIESTVFAEKNPILKFNRLLNLYFYYNNSDTIKASNYLNLASLVAKEHNIDSCKIRVGKIEADNFEDKFLYQLALRKNFEIIELATKNKRGKDEADIILKISRLYRKSGDYKGAMDAGLKGLALFESINDSGGIQKSFNNIGNIYRYIKDFNKALDYYFKSLEFAKLKHNQFEEANIYNNIGIIYKEQDNFELALQYYQKSFAIFQKMNYKWGIAGYYNNSGIIHLRKGEHAKAYSYFRMALKLRKELGDKRNETNAWINLGNYFQAVNNHDSSRAHYEQALSLADKYGFPEKKEEIYLSLSKLSEKFGNYKDALKEYKYYDELNDSILSLNKLFGIAKIEITSNLEKEKIIEESRRQKEGLKRIILFLFLSISLLIVTIFFIAIKSKLKKSQLFTKKLSEEKVKIEYALLEKNKEFAAYSLYLAQKNELIKDISNSLRKNLVSDNHGNKQQIKEIISKIESESNVNVWEEFEARFLQVYEGFYEKLMQRVPSLSLNERRLCAFLRLDMSTKEISLITGQSPHSINVARTRLRRKLGLAYFDQSISSFLSSL